MRGWHRDGVQAYTLSPAMQSQGLVVDPCYLNGPLILIAVEGLNQTRFEFGPSAKYRFHLVVTILSRLHIVH